MGGASRCAVRQTRSRAPYNQARVAQRRPILAPALNAAGEDRWPALTQAILGHGIQAIFALPVAGASTPIGALDLYRRSSGPLDDAAMNGGVWAAGLAALPLLDLMTSDTDWQKAADDQGSWDQLASMERVEVYQAAGMIVAALEVTPADALVRFRAHAISRSVTASDVAYQILNRASSWTTTPGTTPAAIMRARHDRPRGRHRPWLARSDSGG